MNTKKLTAIMLASLTAMSLSACSSDSTEPATSAQEEQSSEASYVSYEKNKEATDSQNDAAEAAVVYLETMPMSKQALFDQLKYDSYSAEDAQYAIDNINADWNEEALEAAENYYDSGTTDTNEIYNQLISEYGEQFTTDEAQYAIDNLDPSTLDAQ